MSEAEAIGMPTYEELRKRVVQAYKELEPRCDFVGLRGHGLRRRRTCSGLRAERGSRERARVPGARRGQGGCAR